MSERPPSWAVLGTLVGALLFIGALIVYVPYVLSGWRFSPPFLGWRPLRWIGATLIIFSVPVVIGFLMQFVREGHGTPMPMAPPLRLVVGGPFRFVRNPSYVAALAALFGQGLLFGSIRVLVYAALMALAFYALVVGYEEPTLRRKFGAAYETYCRYVPRWVPRFRRPE